MPSHSLAPVFSRPFAAVFALTICAPYAHSATTAFQIEEASIAGIHQAIRSGQTTCKQIVQAYIDRAKAYNGVCTKLVTADGGTDGGLRAASLTRISNASKPKLATSDDPP